jgi:hypothetical protein
MAAQLTSQKRPGQADGMEVRALSARATNAERRLINAQNQLVATEEKMASINQKTANADIKWEARVKEYESRLKAAEERVKRERQGSKERVAELENNLKCVPFLMCHISFVYLTSITIGVSSANSNLLKSATNNSTRLLMLGSSRVHQYDDLLLLCFCIISPSFAFGTFVYVHLHLYYVMTTFVLIIIFWAD